MTARVLEAVPNFSEGRDPGVLRGIVQAMEAAGADVLDWTSDRQHHRAVVTIVGQPAAVEDAAVAAAAVARDSIDLRRHRGLHPRIGALDVLPFVPLLGLTMDDARATAHRAGQRIARDVGLPVYFYALASDPPGRTLAELRRGGFEAIAGSWPAGRMPDLVPADWPHQGAHPTAGAVCVGARRVLLAWNVYVQGTSLEALRRLAQDIRETGGGMQGLRALAFRMPESGELQLSMNLENAETSSPVGVFRRIEAAVNAQGGSVLRTEVIGLVPDRLVLEAAGERLHLDADAAERLLSRRLLTHLAR